MNFAFLNPRLWLRNGIKAAPKIKQRWRDWLNAPSLSERVARHERQIAYWGDEIRALRRCAKTHYRASESQAPDTGPATHSAGTHDCNRA